MAGRVAGKVAFITGAARGQGRSHALRFAQEGADIIAVDICAPIATVTAYPLATPADLAETVRLVEALDRRIVAVQVDVRDTPALEKALNDGVGELGRLDFVIANAGIFEMAAATEVTGQAWDDVIGVNLTGVWNTVKVALPHLIAGGEGGAIVLTSSTAGLKGTQNMVHYTASKHGVVGVVLGLTRELGKHRIRINSVHPTSVDTDMIMNESMWRLFQPDNPNPTRESVEPVFRGINALPVPWVEPIDISNAVLFLCSDEARYISGVALPVDAGNMTT
jgi:SDR family mycofactocin-dependent oxidoreductase